MSTLSDWSYLPLLLNGPLYLVPDPANPPEVPPVAAAAPPAVPAPPAVVAPKVQAPPVEVPPVAAAPKVQAPSAPPVVATPPVAPAAVPPAPVSPPPTATPLPATPKAAPVVPKIPVPVQAPSPPAPRRRSRVMVLYNEQTTPYLQPAHETLLVNILKSIGLTLDDIELVNLNNIRRVDYVEILKEKTLHQFISFGIDLRELQINVPLTAYKVQRVEEINMLLADSFHELVLNTEKKRLLWTCLKQMFLK